MKCLIDQDILNYEIGSCGEYDVKDEETGEKTGEHVIRHPEFVLELLDNRIREIEEECSADERSTLYLTGDVNTIRMYNHYHRYEDIEPLVFKPNFRIDVATVKPYKGNRKDVVKPFHTSNIINYVLANYDVKVANGFEADDYMMIDCYKDLDNTIICTRDKDLRQGGKHHFGWECGLQPQFGPKEIDPFGEIVLSANRKKIVGEGIKFFYSQLLTGDTVDNIPGLPGCGVVKTFELLGELETELDLYTAVEAAYADKYGEGDHLSFLQEQAMLLWMVRRIRYDGTLVMWSLYDAMEGNGGIDNE